MVSLTGFSPLSVETILADRIASETTDDGRCRSKQEGVVCFHMNAT